MQVLITGAGGFIGSHLVQDQLKKGNSVRALDVDLSAVDSWRDLSRLHRIRGDIRDAEIVNQALEKVDVVFHLASAHLSVRASEREYREVNVAAAENLVRMSQMAGVKRFVHCSTVGIYGNLTELSGNENSPANPDLVYEKTKLAGEQAVLRVSEETRYPITIVRPVWVYGPGCPRTAKLFRAIQRRRFVMVGSGRTLRHCIYVSDMVEGFDLCATRDEAIGQSFIVGDDAAITIGDLVREIAALVTTPPPNIRIPVWVMAPACAVSERLFTAAGKEPPLSKRSLKFFTNNTSFDISKAKHLLQFSPRVPLRTGLEQTYDYLMQNGQLN